jgi:Fic family protein
MRTFAAPADEELLRAEARGAAAALVADDLVAPLAADPQPTLAELHRRLTDGLVAPARAGRPRASEQAVHDASLGRIIYFTPDPAQLPAALAGLADWLAGDAADLPGLHAAGLLHLELLRLHPYDAANGRLARAAARLWLRGAGLDPAGLAVPELLLADDPLGYHEQVAGSLRRRDAAIWLERWAEAVVAGLRGSLHALTGPPTPAAADLLTDLPATFTLADLRDRRPGGGDLEPLWDELADLEDAALVAVVPGTRGLRFRRTDPPA